MICVLGVWRRIVTWERQPNPEQTSYQFRSALLFNAVGFGNGYAEIERDGGGRPAAFWHIEPYRVWTFRERGQLFYRVTQPSGGHVVIPARDMIHIKGPSPDGECGFNTVEIAREALGLALASERFGATYFSNGTQLGGILSTNLTGAALENLRTAIAARHQGVDRAHRWLLTPTDTKFTEVGTSPRDSQLTELREHEVREIARFLRIPVAMIGDLSRATWSNFEQQQRQYFGQCIRPWCANVEQELTLKLVSPFERSQQYIEHVTEGFLRADIEKRGAYYVQAIGNGWMTINEVRTRENLPPLPGGDVARVPMNTEALTAPTVDDEDAPNENADGRKAAMIAAQREVMVEAVGRIIRKEIDRARKASTTPAKLRAFCEFYDDIHHLNIAAVNLTPGIRSWLAFIGSDADAALVTDALLRRHFADSKSEILKLADLEQGEAYELAFNSVMLRWESDRAKQLVDWFIRHGVTPDGNLAFSPSSPAANPSTVPRTRSVAFLEKWSRTQRLKEQMALEAEQAKRNPLAIKEKQLEAARAR